MRTETIARKLECINKVLIEHLVNQKKVLNSTEAAIYLKHTRGYIYRLVRNENLPYFRPKGRRLYFKKKELNFWRLTRQHPLTAKAKKHVTGFSQNGG
jgi:excisionase family DNA binding protein